MQTTNTITAATENNAVLTVADLTVGAEDGLTLGLRNHVAEDGRPLVRITSYKGSALLVAERLNFGPNFSLTYQPWRVLYTAPTGEQVVADVRRHVWGPSSRFSLQRVRVIDPKRSALTNQPTALFGQRMRVRTECARASDDYVGRSPARGRWTAKALPTRAIQHLTEQLDEYLQITKRKESERREKVELPVDIEGSNTIYVATGVSVRRLFRMASDQQPEDGYLTLRTVENIEGSRASVAGVFNIDGIRDTPVRTRLVVRRENDDAPHMRVEFNLGLPNRAVALSGKRGDLQVHAPSTLPADRLDDLYRALDLLREVVHFNK